MCVVKVDMALIENSAVRLWVCLMRKKNNLLFLTSDKCLHRYHKQKYNIFWVGLLRLSCCATDLALCCGLLLSCAAVQNVCLGLVYIA